MKLFKHTYTISTALAFALLANSASAQLVQIEDTFSRPDDTALGQTEVGGFGYIEGSPAGVQPDAALIFEGELFVHGFEGVAGSAPGVALIDEDLADVTLSSTIRFQNLIDPINAGSRNVAGYILRRNGSNLSNVGSSAPIGFNAAHEGQIEVTMGAGGGFFVREVHNGALRTLLGTTPPGNPFGGAQNNLYSSAGQLPSTVNSLPFDADSDGKLEDNEPFQLGVSLVGSALQVQINGQTVHNLTVSRSAPINYRSVSGFYKNRFTSAANLDNFNAGFDNFVMSGSSYAPAAPTPIVHQGDVAPLTEAWFPQNGSVGVTNNGAVRDGSTAAWNINDSSGAVNTSGGWSRFLREDQIPIAQTEGWTMKASISVLNTADTPDGAIELSVYAASDKGYTLWLGSDAMGNPIVGEFQGTLPTLTLGRTVTLNSGPGYHDYEMSYDPVSQTVDLFVDGALTIDDMAPINRNGAAINRVLWGSNSGTGIGNANYSSVEFIVGAAPDGQPGDFDGDEDVDGADFLAWQQTLGSSVAPGTGADADGDGTIDGDDLGVWRSNFGETASIAASQAAVAAVPEPAVLSLLAVGLLALGSLRRVVDQQCGAHVLE